jgi:hypothetical protein
MRTFIIGCEKKHLSIRQNDKGKISKGKFTDKEGLKKYLKKVEFNEDTDVLMCSSSVDFPEEYTKSTKLKQLCRWLRQ